MSSCNVDINSDLLIEIRSNVVSEPDENTTLLGQGYTSRFKGSIFWLSLHWAECTVGAVAFVVGNCMYSHPEWEYGPKHWAEIYTLGSLALFISDVMEFFGLVPTVVPRLNLWWSVNGSLMYIIGSIGFFPEIYNQTPMLGILGFVLGSFLIGCSQYWKVYRIGKGTYDRFQFSNLFAEFLVLVEVGVELSVGFGAWCYLIGMGMYLVSTLEGSFEGPWYLATLYLCNAGAAFFLLRPIFIGIRIYITLD